MITLPICMRKRTITDKIICGFNSARFAMLEPVLLKIARLKHKKEYFNDKENPLISVYIPTYNRGKLLVELAIPSVLSQTYKNFELIIVGDCCTDNTEKLVSEIRDPRIRFYNLAHRGYRYPPTAENHWLAGPVVANNQALKLIRGKWIATLDDDDIWTKDHLETLLRFAQKGNFEFVSSSYITESNGVRKVIEGERVDGPYYHPNRQGEGSGPKIGGDCTWFYRSYLKFFKYNINCWRKKWNRVNDIELSQRIYRAGVKIGYLDNSLAYVLPRPGEKTVGLESYKELGQKIIDQYKFN